MRVASAQAAEAAKHATERLAQLGQLRAPRSRVALTLRRRRACSSWRRQPARLGLLGAVGRASRLARPIGRGAAASRGRAGSPPAAAPGRGSATARRCPATTSRQCRTRPPAGDHGACPLARCSTTASTAVPIAPPTRCSTFSCGVASDSCSGRSDANAAVIAGMKDRPMPTPAHDQHQRDHDDRGARRRRTPAGSCSGTGSSRRTSATRPPPKRSVSRPATASRPASRSPAGREQPGVDHALAAHLLVVERHEDHRPE